ncbi:MAG: DUF2182 domain-containing protein [Chloroflexota bacterium]
MTTARLAPSAVRLPARVGVWGLVALAWAAIAVADATGVAGVLHHHALIEGGVPTPIAVGLFTAGWIVMVAAMMIPASSWAIIRHAGAPGFLASYLVLWTLFGLFCFAGDGVIHSLVDTTPWLAANAWIIPALSLAGAGVYQLLPAKRHFIAACLMTVTEHDRRSAIRAGTAHALDCVGGSGLLMLLMFAAGFASIGWMVALAALMFYEVRGAHASTVIRVSGVLLIWLALLTSMSGAVPGWAGA